MRFKIVVTLLFLAALGAAALVGWFKWKEHLRDRDITQTLTVAQGQLEEGNHERAQVHFERILRDYPDLPGADHVLAKLAESYTATGNADKALFCWKRIAESFPDSDHYAKALSALADDAFANGKKKEAETLWDRILSAHKGSDCLDDAKWGKARLVYEAGDAEGARSALRALQEEFSASNRMAEIEKLLGRINIEILYSSAMAEGDQIYKIERGDTLVSIGKKFGVSSDLIAKVNHVEAETFLPLDRRLKIPKTDFSIEVNKSDNTLLLLNGGKFFKRYPARTGKEDWLTPVGVYRIQRKVKNPPWNDPKTHRAFPPNDPGNELGTRWLAFEGSLGIHGTIHPETIGTYASNGCVGLMKEDVEELYDLVPVGTVVKISGKMQKSAKTSDS